MYIKYFQKGFNFSQDGPGNRLVYHLQGCNMHCPWCSNPEGMAEKEAVFCSDVTELAAEIISCSPMYFSGGGVTFTGGEASLQLDALKELLSIIGKEKIHTAIETNGTNPRLSELCGLMDYWIMDFKHPDSEMLKKITGMGNETIIRNIQKISSESTVHIRIPLIHGFNDSKQVLDSFTEFFSELKSGKKNFDIEILPYHEYGKEKWIKSDREYTVNNGFVPEKTVKLFENRFAENSLTVIHT